MNPDLFAELDSLAGWNRDPRAAFLQWLAGYRPEGRALRQSTCVIYSGMFDRLLHWAQARGQSLFDLEPADYEAFVTSKGLGEETRHRYLLLFTALFRHLNIAMEDNAALSLLRRQPAPESSPSDVLMPEAVARFIKMALSSSERNWKRRRNQAMMALALGAGLHSHEIRFFRIEWIHLAASGAVRLDLPRHDVLPARKVPLLPVPALRERLLEWHAERPRIDIPGELFFPADIRGGALDASTIYRIVDRALASLQDGMVHQGTDRGRKGEASSGPSLLRNTFCAMAQTVHHVAEVKSFMGHAQVRSTLELARPGWRLEDLQSLS